MPDKFCLAPSGVGQRHRRCTIRYDLAVDDGARDVEALHLVTDSGATRKTRSTRRADVPPLAEEFPHGRSGSGRGEMDGRPDLFSVTTSSLQDRPEKVVMVPGWAVTGPVSLCHEGRRRRCDSQPNRIVKLRRTQW